MNEMSCKHERMECAESRNEFIFDSEIVKMETEGPEHFKTEKDHKLSYACLKTEESENKESIIICETSLCKTDFGSEDSKQLNDDDHRKYDITGGKCNQEVHIKVKYDSEFVKLRKDGPEDLEIDIEEHKIRRRCLEIGKTEDMESMSTSGDSSKVNCDSEDSHNSNKEIINLKDVKIEIELYTQNKTIDRQDAAKISDEKEIMKYVSGAEKQDIDPAAIKMNSQHCELEVKDEQYLKKYFGLKHDDSAEWYRCQQCKYETKRKSVFKHHFRLKHDDSAEWYRCKHCEYETKSKSDLKRHFKVKHDECAELYRCEHCEFKTKTKTYLNKHFKIEHDDSAEWYRCKHCEYETKDKSNLKQHFKVKHDECAEWYRCEHCEFKTKTKTYLNKHFRLKHDDSSEWYKCQQCKFETKRRSNLKRHFKVKHDECAEWYRCEHCEFETKNQCSLKRHFKVKHDECAE